MEQQAAVLLRSARPRRGEPPARKRRRTPLAASVAASSSQSGGARVLAIHLPAVLVLERAVIHPIDSPRSIFSSLRQSSFSFLCSLKGFRTEPRSRNEPSGQLQQVDAERPMPSNRSSSVAQPPVPGIATSTGTKSERELSTAARCRPIGVQHVELELVARHPRSSRIGRRGRPRRTCGSTHRAPCGRTLATPDTIPRHHDHDHGDNDEVEHGVSRARPR